MELGFTPWSRFLSRCGRRVKRFALYSLRGTRVTLPTYSGVPRISRSSPTAPSLRARPKSTILMSPGGDRLVRRIFCGYEGMQGKGNNGELSKCTFFVKVLRLRLNNPVCHAVYIFVLIFIFHLQFYYIIAHIVVQDQHGEKGFNGFPITAVHQQHCMCTGHVLIQKWPFFIDRFQGTCGRNKWGVVEKVVADFVLR